MYGKKIKFAALLALMALLLCACGSDGASGGAHKLSFKQALSYDALKALDGKQVSINGYLATSSPVDGSFIFLMNLPYQSCPFCKPNTSELSNTMEVYPKKGKTFSYTNQAVKVTGTLRVAPEGNSFTDLYGYEFNFKIVDAEYAILKDKDLSDELKLWQAFAKTDLITELNDMHEYVNFLCKWNTYFVRNYIDETGTVQPGYYLYPADALSFLTVDGAQFNYGYQPSYFEGLIARIRAVDENAFEELVSNVKSAQALAELALSELMNGNYTYEQKYVEEFDNIDLVFTLDRADELDEKLEALFTDYANWISGWEL